MSKSRLLAFTDGVIAIIITIMVLELRPPEHQTLAALFGMWRIVIVYLASFLTLAVYWINHHHLFQLVRTIPGNILWANTFFLLTASFFPLAMSWLGQGELTALVPELLYGFVHVCVDVSFGMLARMLAHDRTVAAGTQVILHGYMRKTYITVAVNIVALASAFVWPPLVLIINGLAIGAWIVPDKKTERHVRSRLEKK